MTDTVGKAHLFAGLAAAGKTTLAKDIEKQQQAVRFTLDEWMIRLYPDLSISEDEYGQRVSEVKALIWQTAVSILQQGVDVVLDWSLWNQQRRANALTRLQAINADHTLYYLNMPISVLQERLSERNEKRPSNTHPIPPEELARFAPHFQPPTPEEGLNIEEILIGYDQPIHNPHLPGQPFLWEGERNTGILLLHGLTATPAEVHLLAQRLHAQGYTISAPLLPGHGTKPEDLNEVRWRDWVWEAEKAYQHLATICDHVFVGGESTGAVVALQIAIHKPEVAGVLAYAPAIKLNLPRQRLIRLYIAAPLIGTIPKQQVNANPNWQGYRVNPLRAVIELIRLGRLTRQQLAQINQPVLVVQGRHDTTISPDSGDIILDGISSEHKELHWMEESPHVVILADELDEITQHTLRFLESHTPQ